MSIQIACHKWGTDNLTKKLLTKRAFIHVGVAVISHYTTMVYCTLRPFSSVNIHGVFSCNARKKNF